MGYVLAALAGYYFGKSQEYRAMLAAADQRSASQQTATTSHAGYPAPSAAASMPSGNAPTVQISASLVPDHALVFNDGPGQY